MSARNELNKYLANFGVNMNVAGPLIDKTTHAIPTAHKIEDYLYYLTYDDINYDAIKQHSDEYELGGCSSAVTEANNFFIRNYDWYYDNTVSFVVSTTAKEDRHASIGIASSIKSLTKEFVESGAYNEAYEYLPGLMLDGINDQGVACSINVAPTGDAGQTTGTNPGAERLNFMEIVRYILDNADSAEDAISLIQDCDLYAPIVNGKPLEIHCMVADAYNAYVIEAIDNTLSIIDFSDESTTIKPIMTNFYLTNFDGNTATAYYNASSYDKDTTTLTPHASGIERYDILLDAVYNQTESITTPDEAIEAIASVNYTQAYSTTTNPVWYSEFVGPWKGADLTTDTAASDFSDVLSTCRELYEHRSRNDGGKTWQTVHSSIYNLAADNPMVWFTSQESDQWYSFMPPAEF